MRFLFPLFLFLLLTPVAFADDLAGPSVTVQEGSARLIAARLPDGSSMMGLDLTLTPGWHTYWQNPGDSGLPPKLTLLAPAKKVPVALVPIFPVPERFETSGIVDYGYHDALLLPFRIMDGDDAVGPLDPSAWLPMPLRIKATWLACKDICLPESAELSFDARTAETIPPQLEEAVSRAPVPANAHARYAYAGDYFLLELEEPQSFGQVFPISQGMVALTPKPVPAHDGLLTHLIYQPGLTPAKTGFDFITTPGAGPAKQWHAVYNERMLANAPIRKEATTPPENAPLPQLPLILFFALLGGLLLNVMPCVLPILSLKILSLIEHPEGRKGAIAQGMGYLLGIEGALLVLAGILLSLKAGSHALGWGFQLQSPTFLCFLMIFTFLIGLNLSGLIGFNLSLPSGASSRPRSLWVDSIRTGIFAVLVATPCTAPFMATAMGATLLLPAGPSLLIFLFLGLGMATPFLLISLVPAFRHALPKPGQWMVTLKHALAFPMYATAAWLLWLLGAVGGLNALGIGLVLLLLAVSNLFLLRLLGRYARISLSLLVLLAILLLFGRIPHSGSAPALPEDRYSAARLSELREAGTPVLVNATASWCLTCKVNEKVALSDDKVKAHFAKQHLILLTADWTRSDPAITEYLASLGRSGVPAYVYYPPHGETKLLPQILTPNSVIAATTP